MIGGVVDGYSSDEESDDDDDVSKDDNADDSLDEDGVQRKVEAFNKKQMLRIKKLEGMKMKTYFLLRHNHVIISKLNFVCLQGLLNQKKQGFKKSKTCFR